MNYDSEARWAAARNELIVRWRTILERIAARDEGGALSLVNVVDEFCEESARARATDPPVPSTGLPLVPESAPITPFGKQPAENCLYCRGFKEYGGCFGTVEAINRAVQSGDWAAAGNHAQRYLLLLEEMTFHT